MNMLIELKIKVYVIIYRTLNKIYNLKGVFYRLIEIYNNEKSKNKFDIIKNSLDSSWNSRIPKLDIQDDDKCNMVYNYINSINKDENGYTWHNRYLPYNINKFRIPDISEFVPGFKYYAYNAFDRTWNEKVITQKQIDEKMVFNGVLWSIFILFDIKFKLDRNEILVLKDENKR